MKFVNWLSSTIDGLFRKLRKLSIIAIISVYVMSCADSTNQTIDGTEPPVENYVVEVKNNIISLGEDLTVTFKNNTTSAVTVALDIKYPSGGLIRQIGLFTSNPNEDPIEMTWNSSDDAETMTQTYGLNFIASVDVIDNANDPDDQYFHIARPMVVEYDWMEGYDVLNELSNNASDMYREIVRVYKEVALDISFDRDNQDGYLNPYPGGNGFPESDDDLREYSS